VRAARRGLILVLLAAAGCAERDRGPADGSARGAPAAREADAGRDGAPELFERWDLDLPPMETGRPGSPTILEVNGGGVALFDGDDDGDLDLLLVIPGAYPASGNATGGTNRLYRNDGGVFVDVTEHSGVAVPGFCNGVAIGDVDHDGDRDVYLTRHGPNTLLLNRGGLRFEPAAGALGAAGDAWSTSAVFFDADRDGDLDLYVVNYLELDPDDPPRDGVDGRVCRWKGMPVMCGPQGLPPRADRAFRLQDGRFVEATAALGLDAPPAYGLGVIDGDLDDDGRTDLYVSNDSVANFLFLARGEGGYVENGLLSGTALSGRGREQAGMGIACGDLDGDLRDELMVTNFSDQSNAVYRNLGDGLFIDDADPMGLGGPSRRLLGWGTAFLDVDLDRDLDVVCANGHVYPQADAPGTGTSWAQPARLWLNDGRGRFRQAAWPGDAPIRGRALAVGDLDGDRVADVVVARLGAPPLVLRGLARGEVLQVVVEGPPGNPDGYGSVVTWTDAHGPRRARVRASAGYQAVGDPRPTFAFDGPGRLRVEVPDGRAVEREVGAPGRVTVAWEDAR